MPSDNTCDHVCEAPVNARLRRHSPTLASAPLFGCLPVRGTTAQGEPGRGARADRRKSPDLWGSQALAS